MEKDVKTIKVTHIGSMNKLNEIAEKAALELYGTSHGTSSLDRPIAIITRAIADAVAKLKSYPYLVEMAREEVFEEVKDLQRQLEEAKGEIDYRTKQLRQAEAKIAELQRKLEEAESRALSAVTTAINDKRFLQEKLQKIDAAIDAASKKLQKYETTTNTTTHVSGSGLG
jgi:chromosome segregation ATPase